MSEQRPPLPPFDLTGALQKVQAAEDAWNTRDPHRVSLSYTQDSAWRNRDQFLIGREAIVEFLTAKWERELDYVLRKSLWGFRENRMAVRFQYEWHDSAGQWYRSYGNELWEFDDNGLMRRREASINDVAITEADLRSNVTAGENSGEALQHAPVVRLLRKLQTVQAPSVAPLRVDFDLRNNWNPNHLTAVVFLADSRSRRILAAGRFPLAP